MAHVHSRQQEVSKKDPLDESAAKPAGLFSSQKHRNKLSITLLLTATVFIAEVVGAILTQSLALFVDAGHMLTDISVLTASTVTAILMQRKPTSRRTWGWARLEVLTAAGGAVVLLIVGVYALIEAVIRIAGPGGTEVHDPSLLLFFGLLGLVANLLSLLTLHGQHNDNMNMKAAFLEVLNDAMGSVAVVISAVVMLCTGWGAFDAIAGGLIALLMIPRAISLLVSSVKVLLEEVPSGLDLQQVRRHLQEVPGVEEVHDLHATTVATGLPELSAHVRVRGGTTMEQAEEILHLMQVCLREHFPVTVEHTTFQIETQNYGKTSQEHLEM
ncbi:cation diffusion facilitator family transporter [Bombiscardovia coagulans]|uniref:Cation transporter n=1 Tax=Bombiscardovia coagulans TaxID=686666 RepID=A0A261EP95_9BIFI|nr:cation diffusion facilitator family transporter [Bombiscardovia coagulans]OZG48677.1 cation transporter [Bombiscardovia coagulans]